MQTHDDENRETTSGLSTEDLAQVDQTDEERQTAVYPGEATGDAMPGGTTTDRDAGETAGDEEFGGGSAADRDVDDTATDRDFGGTATAGDRDFGDTAAATERDEGAPADRSAGTGAGGDEEQPLLSTGDAERYRTAWSEIQGRFVDDPQDAVTSADTLVAEVMQSLAGTFATHKRELEGQWQGGGEVATEDLRQALQHYRSFFNRLLKT
ncbi:hypothetical protein [Streptomyces sp. NPDC088762]|uniref:hypothetical protein n=1 Tax=Streptomyces sp. NPDC088762 TaxID=3365891 RepID=UPI00380141E3